MSQRQRSLLMKLVMSVLFSLLLTSFSFAQLTEATMKGTVTDASGGVVPRATVVVTNESTGIVRTTATNQAGNFSLPDIAPGFYSIKVDAPQFQTFQQSHLELSVGKVTEIDIRLQLRGSKQTVEVSAQVAKVPVSTEGRLSDTLQNKQISELPLPQRDIFILPSLSAGATNIPGNTFSYKLTSSPAVTVNGNRYRGNNYVLDGAMNSNTLNEGEPAMVPSLESVEEVQVQTGNFSSEYGRGNGSVVNIRTKSGTNQFHGRAWEYHKNAALDARNFFAASKPPLVFNQFGGNLGGPVIKNKTFFFVSYEGSRSALGQTLSSQVETPEFRNYVFNAYPSGIAASLLKQFPAVTPAAGSGGKRYLGEVDLTTPQGQTIPAVGTAYYNLGDVLRYDQYLTRVDHSFNGGKDTLTGRWISEYERSNGATGSGLAQAMRGFRDPFSGFFGNLNLGETHVFGQKVNDAHFALQDNIIGYDKTHPQVPLISVSGLTAGFGDPVTTGSSTFASRIRTSEGRDTVSFSRSRHIIRTGGEIRKLFIGEYLEPAGAGSFSFNNLLDFAQDKPYAESAFVNPATGEAARTNRYYTFYETALFVQDDWKATSRLTVNLGVRYDYFGTPSGERYGHLSNIIWGPGDTFDERIAGASVGHVKRQYDPSKLNFSPRIGLAYDPIGDGKSSIRAGYSIAYQPLHELSAFGTGANSPDVISALIQPNVGIGTSVLYGIPVPFNPQFKTPLNAQGGVEHAPGQPYVRVSPWIINPNFKSEYSESWFFNVQREIAQNWIVELGYVGTNGINLLHRNDLNRFNGDLLDGTQSRLNPNFSSFSYATNGVTSIYHAMTAEIRHHVGHGLTLQANYRWSKWLDTNSDTCIGFFSDQPESSTGPEDTNNLHNERGRSIFDIPQRFTASAVWEPHRVGGTGFVGKLTNNWQISTLITAQSGRPFGAWCSASYQAGCDFNADGSNYDRPNAPASGAVKDSFSKQDFLTGVFAPSIFPKPTPGTDGNLGRDVYRGPHQINSDFALARGFQVRESKQLQFRIEAFNAFNNVNLYLPNDNLALALKPDKTYSTTSNFGKSTQAFDPRILQLSARFVF